MLGMLGMQERGEWTGRCYLWRWEWKRKNKLIKGREEREGQMLLNVEGDKHRGGLTLNSFYFYYYYSSICHDLYY